MYVVLDTNILHQEGLFSRNMKILERIASTGKLVVCVPELVLREFLTRRVTDAQESLKKSKDVYPEIQRRLPNTEIAQQAQLLEMLNDEFAASLEPSYAKAIENWQQKMKVEILKFSPNMLESVFADYFGGKGAFRSAKYREDLPDSFIAYSILSLLDRSEAVNVVLKDGALRKYLSTQKLSVFDDLTSFFAFEPIKKIIDELDAATRNVEELKAFLASDGVRELLSAYIKNDTEGLDQIYVEENEILGLDALEMDVYGVAINGITPQGLLEVNFGDASYIEPGYFSVPVNLMANTRISFVASYMDFINLHPPRDKLVEMESMNGDGWTDLSEVRKVRLSGYLQIRFDDAWTDKELAPHMQYLTAQNAAVRVSMEINAAQLL